MGEFLNNEANEPENVQNMNQKWTLFREQNVGIVLKVLQVGQQKGEDMYKESWKLKRLHEKVQKWKSSDLEKFVIVCAEIWCGNVSLELLCGGLFVKMASYRWR